MLCRKLAPKEHHAKAPDQREPLPLRPQSARMKTMMQRIHASPRFSVEESAAAFDKAMAEAALAD